MSHTLVGNFASGSVPEDWALKRIEDWARRRGLLREAGEGSEWGVWANYPDNRGQQLIRAFQVLARRGAIKAFGGRVTYADLAAALRTLADEETLDAESESDVKAYISELLRLHAEEGQPDASAARDRDSQPSSSSSR